MSQNIKVMTFNIRVNTDKGANDFELRKSRIIEFLNEQAPDIIGFQEANDHIKDCLRHGLPDYTFIGCGREADYRGESVAVAYRSDRFSLIEARNFWLSTSPSVPGSRYGEYQSKCPRITTSLLLKPRNAEPFLFINTHLDCNGKDGEGGARTRMLGAIQLLQYISRSGYPCIITGDFNAEPDEACIKLLEGDDFMPLYDLTANIKGSFHGFNEMTEEEMSKIDYIFTNFKNPITGVLHDDTPVDGTFMSDHRPVSADVELR